MHINTDKFQQKNNGQRPMSRSLELKQLQRKYESTAVTYGQHHGLVIDSANGSYINDVDGNTVIDFLAGAGSLPLGHCNSELVNVAKMQLDTLVHGLDFQTPIKSEFVELLLNKLPETMRGKTRVHFCGATGADAVEAAIKLCKKSKPGGTVFAFSGAYHGCTHATMALSGSNELKSQFNNLMPGVQFFPFQSVGKTVDIAGQMDEMLSDTHSGVGNVCAVIIELVQGEGGVNVADYDFVKKLRFITAKHGIPLIIDEIQSGCGRTGKWYSFEHFGIEPDVVISSKSLSGIGLPMSVILYNDELLNWSKGDHIGTFRGNQLAFAAGAKYMEIYETKNIAANVIRQGKVINDYLNKAKEQFSFIDEIRGIGLMIGIQILDPVTKSASYQIARLIQERALQKGLLIELGGRKDSVVRMLPALNVSDAIVKSALDILDAVLKETALKIEDSKFLSNNDYCI